MTTGTGTEATVGNAEAMGVAVEEEVVEEADTVTGMAVVTVEATTVVMAEDGVSETGVADAGMEGVVGASEIGKEVAAVVVVLETEVEEVGMETEVDGVDMEIGADEVGMEIEVGVVGTEIEVDVAGTGVVEADSETEESTRSVAEDEVGSAEEVGHPMKTGATDRGAVIDGRMMVARATREAVAGDVAMKVVEAAAAVAAAAAAAAAVAAAAIGARASMMTRATVMTKEGGVTEAGANNRATEDAARRQSKRKRRQRQAVEEVVAALAGTAGSSRTSILQHHSPSRRSSPRQRKTRGTTQATRSRVLRRANRQEVLQRMARSMVRRYHLNQGRQCTAATRRTQPLARQTSRSKQDMRATSSSKHNTRALLVQLSRGTPPLRASRATLPPVLRCKPTARPIPQPPTRRRRRKRQLQPIPKQLQPMERQHKASSTVMVVASTPPAVVRPLSTTGQGTNEALRCLVGWYVLQASSRSSLSIPFPSCLASVQVICFYLFPPLFWKGVEGKGLMVFLFFSFMHPHFNNFRPSLIVISRYF